MLADTTISSASNISETKVVHSDAPSAMDAFARKIIERESPFSLKMDGVSPDVLEADLIDAIKETGVLDFVPDNTKVGLRVETSENSGEYCAKLEIGSHKLRIFLAQSANELNLEEDKAAYSEMRLYNGKGGRIEVDPPQTVAVNYSIKGTTMTVNNALDPMKYEELKKATKEGPQLVVLYYHDGNEGTFGVENDADATLGAMLNALISGDLSMAEVMEALQDFVELSPESMALMEALAEYQDLLVEAATLEGSENIAEAIAELENTIESLLEQGLDLPDVVLDALQSTFETAQSTAQELGLQAETLDLSTLDLEAAESLVDLIENLSEQLEAGELDSLPPEIQDLLDNIGDIEALIEEHGREHAIQQIAEAMADPAGSKLSQTIQGIVLSLNNPDVQIALPQDALNQTNIFLKANADNIDAVVRQSVIQNLQASLEDLGPNTEAAQAIKTAIEQLQDGQDIASLDVDILNQIKDHANALVVDNLDQVIQTVENAAADPVVLSNETLENIQSITNDLESVQNSLNELQENGQELSTEQLELAQKLENVIDALNADPSNLQALQELSSLNETLANPENAALIPESLTDIVEQISQNAEQVVTVQETALSIKHDVDVRDIRNVVEIVATLEASKEVLEATDINIDQMLETLNEGITSLSATQEITKLQVTLENVAPEAAQALQTQLEQVLETQVEAVSEKLGIAPEAVRTTVETINALETITPEMQEALAQADVNIAEIVETLKADITSVESLQDMAKLEAVMAELPSEMQAAISEQLSAQVQSVVEVQTQIIAENIDIDPQSLRETVELVTSLEVNPELSEALKNADVDIQAILSVPRSMEALTETAKLQGVLEGASPEIAQALQSQLDKVVDVQSQAVQQEATVPISENTQNPETSSKVEFDRDSNVIDAREIFQQAAKKPPEVDTLKASFDQEAVIPEAQFDLKDLEASNLSQAEAATESRNPEFSDVEISGVKDIPTSENSDPLHSKFESVVQAKAEPAPEILINKELDAVIRKEYESAKVEQQAAQQEDKQEQTHRTGCDACTHKDCANCSKGAAKAQMNNALADLKMQREARQTATQDAQNQKDYQPPEVQQKPEDKNEAAHLTGCEACTSKDCANCSKGAAKQNMTDALSKLKEQREQTVSNDNKTENQYKAPEVQQKPENQNEAAHLSGCEGCTTKDCANCSKGAAKTQMNDALANLREQREQAVPKTDEYKQMQTQAQPDNKEEQVHRSGCEGCTSKDCANCSKDAAKSNMQDALSRLKQEKELSGKIQDAEKTESYKPIETNARTDNEKEAINRSGCEGCTSKDCANCSKGAAKTEMQDALSKLREAKTEKPPEYESQVVFNQAQDKQTPEEKVHSSACDACTTKDCANCSKGAAKSNMQDALKKLQEQRHAAVEQGQKPAFEFAA